MQTSQRSESVGSVRPGSREHLWAAYETAISEWERAGAVERAQYAAYEFAGEAWRQKREEESAAWRRSREAFEAWQRAADREPVQCDRREVS
jgi:predicted nucleic acid-binding protein